MSRTAQVLLALAVVFLTAAVTISFTPIPGGSRPPDDSVLWLVGIVMLLLAFAVDAQPVRKAVGRIDYLRPPRSRLASVISEGNELRAGLLALREPDFTEGGEDLKTHWNDRVVAWDQRAEDAVHAISEDLVAYYRSEPSSYGAYIGPMWRSNIAQFLDRRLTRLGEIQLRV